MGGKRVRLSFLILSMFMLASQAAFAGDQPPSFKAVYGKNYLVVSAKAVIELQKTDVYYKYTMKSEVRLGFSRNELYDCSVSIYENGYFKPLEHKHTDKNNAKENRTTLFDWDIKKAFFITASSPSGELSIREKLWDPMSLQVQFIYDLLNNNMKDKQTYVYLEEGRLKSYEMEFSGIRQIEIDDEEIETVGIIETQAERAGLWLDRRRGIPIKIKVGKFEIDLLSELQIQATGNTPIDRAAVTPPRC